MRMTAKRVVHWFVVHPTPYHDFFFRALAQSKNIDLRVHYQSLLLSSHPWKQKMASGYDFYSYHRFLGIDWTRLLIPFRHRDNFEALYIVAGWNDLTNILLLSLLRMFRRHFVVWTDTPNLSRKRGLSFTFLRNLWLKWIFSGANYLLATGEPGVKGLRQMVRKEARIISFPFWCDLDLLNPAKRGKSSHGISFMSSGRLLNSLKGHDLALKALAKAMEGYRDTWVYRIAGVGPDQSVLERLAYELGILSNVRFLGWLDKEDLVLLYLESDILLHPSPVHDPFPNSVLEAMAAGLVVMGSNLCGSVLDRIDSGINGYIHTAGNWHELAGQIAQVIRNREKLREISIRARQTAELWPVERGLEIVRRLAVNPEHCL